MGKNSRTAIPKAHSSPQRLSTSDRVSGQRAWPRSVMRDRARSASLCHLILLGCCCCIWTLNFRNNIDIHTRSTNLDNHAEQRRLELILLRIIRKQSNNHIFIEWKVHSWIITSCTGKRIVSLIAFLNTNLLRWPWTSHNIFVYCQRYPLNLKGEKIILGVAEN